MAKWDSHTIQIKLALEERISVLEVQIVASVECFEQNFKIMHYIDIWRKFSSFFFACTSFNMKQKSKTIEL